MIEHGPCPSGLIALLNGACSADAAYKLALYTNRATIGPQTTVYTTAGEVVGGGYPAGGILLTRRQLRVSAGAVVLTWEPAVLQNTSIASVGAMIYHAAPTREALFVLAFGEEVVSKDGPFIVPLPSIDDGGVFGIQLPQSRHLLR